MHILAHIDAVTTSGLILYISRTSINTSSLNGIHTYIRIHIVYKHIWRVLDLMDTVHALTIEPYTIILVCVVLLYLYNKKKTSATPIQLFPRIAPANVT